MVETILLFLLLPDAVAAPTPEPAEAWRVACRDGSPDACRQLHGLVARRLAALIAGAEAHPPLAAQLDLVEVQLRGLEGETSSWMRASCRGWPVAPACAGLGFAGTPPAGAHATVQILDAAGHPFPGATLLFRDPNFPKGGADLRSADFDGFVQVPVDAEGRAVLRVVSDAGAERMLSSSDEVGILQVPPATLRMSAASSLGPSHHGDPIALKRRSEEWWASHPARELLVGVWVGSGGEEVVITADSIAGERYVVLRETPGSATLELADRPSLAALEVIRPSLRVAFADRDTLVIDSVTSAHGGPVLRRR